MSLRAMASANAFGSLLLLTVCPAARAQAEPSRTPALDAATERFESGKRLFREGTKEHDASKVERAYFEFKAAYAIYPGRGTLLNLVETELATHRDLDAMRHIREYARSYGVPDEHSDYRRAFDKHSEAAFKATGHVEIVGPARMRVVIDGNDEALLTPLRDPVDLTAGHHVIELVGSATLRGEANASAGAVTRLAFAQGEPAPAPSLAPSPSPAPPPPTVPVAPVPVEPSPPPTLPRLPTDVPPPRAPSFWTPTHVWGAVVGVAGLASVGTGLVFAARANQDADRASSLVTGLGPSGCVGVQSQDCSNLQSAHDDQSRDHALNLVFVSVGAAAVVSGAALLLWPAHASGQAGLVPVISPYGGGLQFRGDL
jgi:hypothetical protein